MSMSVSSLFSSVCDPKVVGICAGSAGKCTRSFDRLGLPETANGTYCLRYTLVILPN